MHCKQAGSALLKISLFEFNSNTSVYHKTDLCGNYALLAWHGLCRIYALSSRIRVCRKNALLWMSCPDFYSDIECFTQILCIYLPKKLAAKTSGPTLKHHQIVLNVFRSCYLKTSSYPYFLWSLLSLSPLSSTHPNGCPFPKQCGAHFMVWQDTQYKSA